MNESRETLNISEPTTKSNWSKHDTRWTLSLFGTAVGAGILFLPINLGVGGFWPLVLMAILAFPMAFLSHRGLNRFVLSSSSSNADFTDVVKEHFGAKAGLLISSLYFLSIFPILLIYGVAITNTVDSFLVNQVGMSSIPRPILSGTLVFSLIAIMMAGEKVMLRVFALMVYPLVLVLTLISLYLIPHWSMPNLSFPETGAFLKTTWLAIPVVIFSFSHAAAISSFANVQRRHYGQQGNRKSEQILRCTNIMLVVFVLFFVFSCTLSLSPEQLLQAKEQNVSILSYLANANGQPFIDLLGPLVAFVAITSSFLGHFLGARESLNGLLVKQTSMSSSTISKCINVFLFLAIWCVAIINPSILDMMGDLSGPIIAMILFIMPTIAIFKVKSLHKFRYHISTAFVFITGTIAVSALIFQLVN
ncbi:HAAAP family serine/threonine permease [Vibrio azureus]|uniref:Serine transporter n=1 Tax=Vibrio azureus NBRC 104587 TaxID=1219077 RepID=U3AW21_9VIBR|nr:aromatic amino acid transport family protein [Vibrio azureus]AUI88278.1 HAAAP family serine/threonine permease [Vibrio azureus]GAD77432.1 serine transporter [Vibrio azureus NBRC 104587]